MTSFEKLVVAILNFIFRLILLGTQYLANTATKTTAHEIPCGKIQEEWVLFHFNLKSILIEDAYKV